MISKIEQGSVSRPFPKIQILVGINFVSLPLPMKINLCFTRIT